MAVALLSDPLWDLVEPLLPIPLRRAKGGRPRVSDCACLTGILFVLRSDRQAVSDGTSLHWLQNRALSSLRLVRRAPRRPDELCAGEAQVAGDCCGRGSRPWLFGLEGVDGWPPAARN